MSKPSWRERLGRGGRPLRIAYGRIFHEANAFSPLVTTREDFERMHYVAGEALAKVTKLSGSELVGYLPHAELTGFVQAARLAGGVTTLPLVSALAVPGGPIVRASFESIVDDLMKRLEDAGPVDGVYLALHGSMEVAGLDEAPETYILRRVRAIVAKTAMVAVSYDLHANLTSGTIDQVDILIGYRTNPHWDLAPSGFRAGNRLIRALRGQVRPVQAWRKLPIVLGGGMTIDFLPPMRRVFRFVRQMEKDPRVLSASVFMVHPYTSAENLGWSVHVCTDGDETLAANLVDELADRVWAQRDVKLPPMRTAAKAIEEVARTAWRHLGPVSLVDVDDIVGAGAPGGNTRIVRALLASKRGLIAYVPVHDPAAVEAAWDTVVGEPVSLVLRGTPGYDQPEVPLGGIVAAKMLTDFGRVVRIDIGTVHVVVAERPPLPIHPKFWRALGLSPRKADLIVQKNFFHYRIFYAFRSFRHLPVVTGGATSLDAVRERAQAATSRRGFDTAEWRRADPSLRAMARRSGPRLLPAERATKRPHPNGTAS
jgi:microcystin degradation protein MlrC